MLGSVGVRLPLVKVLSPDWVLQTPSLVQTTSLDSPALEIDINATAYRLEYIYFKPLV